MAATNDSTLTAWSQRLISELLDADDRAERVAGSLNREQLNWRPAPGAWSIGQCLQHLLIGNQVYLPAISVSLDGRRQSPVEELIIGRPSRWFIRKYIAPSTTRAQAPGKIRPAEDVESSILDEFLRSNVAARELVSRASAYDVNRIRFKNPFLPFVRFTVGTGLEITAKHESRHLLQAERVRECSTFPSGE